jgi:vacuolar-type H+-ATPase subunit B/Vma2
VVRSAGSPLSAPASGLLLGRPLNVIGAARDYGALLTPDKARLHVGRSATTPLSTLRPDEPAMSTICVNRHNDEI